jgi:DNA-binding transcriptional LysR family regulator
MDLEALADFNAVASHGGFGRASRITGRPKASLSRRVRQLEDSLGILLIERGAHTLRLTEEGAALHEQTAALLDRIDDIKEALMGDVGLPHGKLRVNAPVLFAQRGLGRIAARYAAMFPDVQLEITADDRFIDPMADGYDLVIRANPKPTTELAGRCFLRDELIVAARPSIVRPMMPRSLVQADIDAGRLIIWGTASQRSIEVWALYPPHRHVSRKVSAFIRMLTEQFVDGSPDGFQTLARSNT